MPRAIETRPYFRASFRKITVKIGRGTRLTCTVLSTYLANPIGEFFDAACLNKLLILIKFNPGGKILCTFIKRLFLRVRALIYALRLIIARMCMCAINYTVFHTKRVEK